MLQDFLGYVQENLYVLILVVYFIGYLLKSTPKVADWLIPYFLIVVAVLLAGLLIGFTAEAVVQGILIAAVAVLSNQLIKQAIERN